MDDQINGALELLDGKERKKIVPFSDNHLRRLEAAGEFPARLRIGKNRVAWLRHEVEAWLKTKAAARKQ